jgi:tripartite-type tricarboxylate transporter receptor subunit TctC
MRNIYSTAAALLALASGAFCASAVAADDYPSRPIRIMVGFAPGGAPDMIARVLGEKLAERFGQPVVVENRVGAQGNTAMAAVAKAAADGYTLALMPVGNAAVNPALFANLPYDPVKDFAPISELATFENVLVISAQSPIRDLRQLIAAGRSKTVTLSYATPGAGSLAHLAAELLARSAGFAMNHVPYRRLARCAGGGRSRRIAGLRSRILVCADGAGSHPGANRREAARGRGERPRLAGGESGAGGARCHAGRQLPGRARRGDRGRYRPLGKGRPRRSY